MFGLTDSNVTTFIVAAVTLWVVLKFVKKPRNVPPGPWGIPIFGCMPRFVLSNKGFRDIFRDWYYMYGPIYSLKMGSASMVILNDFKSIHDALIRPEFQDRLKMDVMLEAPGEGVVLSSGKLWQEQRKFVHQIFRDFGVGKASFEDGIVTEATFLTDALLKLDGNIVNVEHLINNAVSNVISSVSFGQRFEYDDQRFQNVLEKFNENMQQSAIRISLSIFLPFTKYLPFGGSMNMRTNMRTYIQFHNEITAEHKVRFDADNMRDIMDAYLLEIKKNEKVEKLDIFNDDNMMWTIGDLFSAGTETTTTTLLWTFLFLLNNPDVEAKVRAQLDEVVGRNRTPRFSDRPHLPLVEAIISESIRLGTTFTLSLPHVASEDSELHGFFIPKGTILVPNLYSLYTNEEKWKDPEKFLPERFLDKDGNFTKPEEFLPFGIGRRLCIGEQLARMELFIFFTHILQKVSFTVPEGSKTPPPKGIDGFTHKPMKYDVKITKWE